MPQRDYYLHSFFEDQADARPNAVALTGINKTYTYRELDLFANQVARHLRNRGVATGDMVGLYCNKSDLPVVAILGILKAGAGYVPLDPTYPDERIGHILGDAGVKVVVSESSLGNKSSLRSIADVVLLDEEYSRIQQLPSHRFDYDEITLKDSGLCYIIYTSGSTGRPKGVMTEHRNIVQFVRSFQKVCNMTPTDRVYQGFSFTFDGSVEEMWMAWGYGAALVTANNDIAGMPSEAAEYMTSQQVTYFSTVPTFLSMIKHPLPTVRLLIVSGEACPQEIVDTWATGRRCMLNVYGPTEATVNTTAAVCRAGKKVTIGMPLEGYELFILDDKMMPVTEGTQGELYIAGPTLSRGYMNLPDITAKAFLPKPEHLPTPFTTVYKTGDLVSLNESKELHFYGRIDHQVKVRGYRIELCEIEAVLREYPSVAASAVKAYENKQKGLTELAAYIVVRKDTRLQMGELVKLLKKRLPPYMIPSYLETVEDIPTLTSGKTDRSRLPQPSTPLIDTGRTIIEAETPLQKTIASIWKEQFKTDTMSIEDNFFTDLGGYSLIAAQTVSLLRSSLSCDLTIRELYSFPTISALAKQVEKRQGQPGKPAEDVKTKQQTETSSQVFKRTPWLTKYGCMAMQALTLTVLYSIPIAGVMGSVLLYQKFHEKTLSLSAMLLISAGLLLAAYPAVLLVSILVKWIAIGKFKAGEYVLWGSYYFRWWLVTRVHRLSGAAFLAGTPLMSVYLRLMGAKIGRATTINTPHISCFDTLEMGDNTAIGFESQLNGYRVENGLLKIGTINIGSGCFTGIQSSLGLNCTMENNSCLDDMSLLSDGDTMQADETRYGSPSKKGTVRLPSAKNVATKKPMNALMFSMLSIAAVYLVEVFLLLTAIPSGAVVYLAFVKNDWIWWISLLAASAVLFELTFWGLMILTKHLVLFRAQPGTYHIRSIYYLRKWIVDSLLSLSRLLTLPVYTTLYALPLLRMLGVNIGKRAELSVLGYVSPDLVSLGQESFFADGSIVGGLRLFNGLCEMSTNSIGSRSFIGNSAVVPAGNSVGDSCLIGVMSVPPAETTETPSGSEWLGSPSFRLPFRKKVEGFRETEIFKPSFLTICSRLSIDALRILIPGVIEIVNLIAMIYLSYYVMNKFPLWQCLLLIPAIGVGLMAGVSFCVVMVKNALVGVYKPVIKPLWSPYVWVNEAVNGTYESVIAPLLMPLQGTPFISVFLRMLGVKIGKHAFIETLLFGEFDLVEIGDYTALNFDVIVQNHLFEDRIFKSSPLKIGNDCSVGNMAVILYDTEMGDGSSIGPLSLLMKGETIEKMSRFEGVPIG